MENEDVLLTPREVAEMCRLSFQTVRRWPLRASPPIPAIKLGGRWRYWLSDVQKALKKGKVKK